MPILYVIIFIPQKSVKNPLYGLDAVNALRFSLIFTVITHKIDSYAKKSSITNIELYIEIREIFVMEL